MTLVRFLNGQAKEIARKCVEAPLLLDPKKETFHVQPSLQRTLTFLIEATVDFHIEVCPICKQKCLPTDGECIETSDTSDSYVERVYCGHIYHQGCLKRFMREPPFPAGGKVCPALRLHPRSDKISMFPVDHFDSVLSIAFSTFILAESKRAGGGKVMANAPAMQSSMCNIRLSHDRWGLSVKLAEARWAQQQARERELEEVKDFLQ